MLQMWLHSVKLFWFIIHSLLIFFEFDSSITVNCEIARIKELSSVSQSDRIISFHATVDNDEMCNFKLTDRIIPPHFHLPLSYSFESRILFDTQKKIYKDLKNVHFCYLGIEKDANYSKEVIHQKQIFTISNQNNVKSSWWVLTLSFIYWNMIMIIIISCYVSMYNEVWLPYLQLLVCSLQELHFLCVFFLFHHSLFLCTFLDLITFSLQFIDLFF